MKIFQYFLDFYLYYFVKTLVFTYFFIFCFANLRFALNFSILHAEIQFLKRRNVLHFLKSTSVGCGFSAELVIHFEG